jgi:RNA polymerase sigma-70 factor (ECF subfamily)
MPQPFSAAAGSIRRAKKMADHGMALVLPRPDAGFQDAGNRSAAKPVVSGEMVLEMDPPSDRALAERAVHGDAEAFAELYRRYQRPIFNYILRCTGQRALAEELLQETFTRVWRVGRTFDTVQGAFRPWLYKIALNTIRSELRKKRHDTQHVPLEGVETETSASRPTEDPAVRLDLSRQARAVVRALDALPPYFKEVVVLRCYQQLKFSEIAEITGAPEGTLKARFHRAVAALRASLGATGGES